MHFCLQTDGILMYKSARYDTCTFKVSNENKLYPERCNLVAQSLFVMEVIEKQ